jgi:hypothetical protein
MSPEAYLRVVSFYADSLGGVRWSPDEDALEYPDGKTFAFKAELAQLIEGFASGRRLIAFCNLVHLLSFLRSGDQTIPEEVARLQKAFARAGRSLRNAGAFFAVLCRDLPDSPGSPDARTICDWLRNPSTANRSYLVSFQSDYAEYPPIGPWVFEHHVLDALRGYTDEELRSWLRHGRGPMGGAGEAAARQLSPPRRTLTGVLAYLLDRPRLAGARAFIQQLASALTLPRRRLAPHEPPMGGYADVTTHGQVSQLLPSQLALDEWDFLRRFADRELLYFRREEPHTQVRQGLVVLLDQGVRTWGDVRLVLSAAVLALGKQAVQGGRPFLLATTSGSGELVDPLQVDDETLGRLLEASDLSPGPGQALERVLEQPVPGTRDVVLLTHARSLGSEDVSGAGRRVAAGVRLFAVGMDEAGRMLLAEMKHGIPVTLGQFRIDVTPAVEPPPPSRWTPRRKSPYPGAATSSGLGFHFASGFSAGWATASLILIAKGSGY